MWFTYFRGFFLVRCLITILPHDMLVFLYQKKIEQNHVGTKLKFLAQMISSCFVEESENK